MNRKMYISRDIKEEKEKKFFKESVDSIKLNKNVLFRYMTKKEMNRIQEIDLLPDLVSFEFKKIEEVKFYGREYSIMSFLVESIFSKNDEVFFSENVSFIVNSELEKRFLIALLSGEEVSICNFLEVYEDSYFNVDIEFLKDEVLLSKIKDVEVRDITLEEEIDVLETFNKGKIEKEVVEKDLSEDNLKKMMGL